MFQPFSALFRPQELKPHQLRPQDMHELNDAGLQASNMAPVSKAYSNPGFQHNPDLEAAYKPPPYSADYNNSNIEDVTRL